MTLDKLKGLEKDDLLNLLGLETRRTSVDYLVPGLALFGIGLVVGAGIGMLVAPRKGSELRGDIREGLQQVPDAVSKLPKRANDAMHRVSDQLSEMRGDHKAE